MRKDKRIANVRFTDEEMLELAECLYEAMEKLDPTIPAKPEWSGLGTHDREFYRYCAEEVALRAGEIAARRPTTTT